MNCRAQNVRQARPEEAERIAHVIRDAFAPYRPLYTADAFKTTVLAAEEIKHRAIEGLLWVVVDGEGIIGTVAAMVRDSAFYLRGMAVRPCAQRHGVGLRLLDRAERAARSLGFTRILLHSTPFLGAAIALYARAGYRPCSDNVSDMFGTPLIAMEKLLNERVSIAQVAYQCDVAAARELLRLYEKTVYAEAQCNSVEACDAGVDDLLGKWTPPDGRLLLLRVEGTSEGCVAFQRVSGNACEMRRLFVRNRRRGEGLGRALAQRVLLEAKAAGYGRIILHTNPAVMKRAMALYRSLAFCEVAPFTQLGCDAVTAMELDLSKAALQL